MTAKQGSTFASINIVSELDCIVLQGMYTYLGNQTILLCCTIPIKCFFYSCTVQSLVKLVKNCSGLHADSSFTFIIPEGPSSVVAAVMFSTNGLK